MDSKKIIDEANMYLNSDFIPLEMKNKLDVVASANRRDLLVNDLKRMR